MNTDVIKEVPPIEEVDTLGRELDAVISIEPYERVDLSCNGALEVEHVTYFHNKGYTIAASVPLALQQCPHCGSEHLKQHGRFFVHLQDLPYLTTTGDARPVSYSITVQRYQCGACNRGSADVIPESVAAAITSSRITRKLSCWLVYKLQTEMSYEVIARMIGLSRVWVRKWYAEVREIYGLGPKPAKPGRPSC